MQSSGMRQLTIDPWKTEFGGQFTPLTGSKYMYRTATIVAFQAIGRRLLAKAQSASL